MKNPFKLIALRIILGISLFTVCSNKSWSQMLLPTRSVQITGGYSEHGSGDMKGITTGAEYISYISGKLFLNYNLRNTINNQTHEIIINNTVTGTTQDASIRFTTAGVQLGLDGGYSFVRNRHLTVSASLGGFLRYQSASNGSDGYSLYGPAATGLPLILVEYFNHTPQKTLAVGGLLQLQLDVNLSRNVYVGLVPRFQTDSNGDAIVSYGLAIGRKF